MPFHFLKELYQSFEPTIAYCLLFYGVGTWFYNTIFGKPTTK